MVSFFTRDHGVVDAIAKGVYRERSPFQAPFDLATLAQIVYVHRPRSEALAIVAEAAQLDGFRGIRRLQSRHAAATYVVEFLRAVGTPGEPAPELFDTAMTTLERLAAAADERRLAEALARFEARSFRALGLSAEIVACGECGRPWGQEDRPVFFSPDVPGILCPSCRGERTRAGRTVSGRVVRRLNELARAGEQGVPVAATALSAASRASVSPAASPAGNGENGLDDREWRQLREVLTQLRGHLLEREFRTLRYTAAFF